MKKKIRRLLALALGTCLLLGATAHAAAPEKVTRGQFIQTLYSANKVHYGNQGTADPVAWAKSLGIVQGYADGSIRPEASVTRTQMAVMLYRYAGMTSLKSMIPYALPADTLQGYDDAASVPAWAETEVKWAVSRGLWFSGSAAHLGPGEQVTKLESETAVMALYNGGARVQADWAACPGAELRLNSSGTARLDYTLRNTGDGWVFCGADTELYRKVNGAWYCVGSQNEPFAAEHPMFPGEERSYQQILLNGALMDLPAGEYRLSRQVGVAQTPHATALYQTQYRLFADFTIE